MVDDNKPLSVSDIEQKEQKIQTMLENNQNPVTEVSEQGAVQATVESLNNCMIPQGSATPDSNSSINAVVPNGTASSGTLLSGTVLQNSYLKMWDGEPLSEGKLYHRNEMIGLPECSIMENRDFWGRAEEWQKKCREVGMAQPAKYVRARIVKQAGYTPALFNKEKGEWEKVSMPKAARITSMSVLGVKADGTVDLGSTEAEATLYYGEAKKDIEFNGNKTFKKKGDLLVARGGSMIHALINPVNLKAADIQAYEIGLTDSKGNTNFVVASIGDNFSENALTRAAEEPEATANKGIYDLTLKFADEVDYNTLKDFDSETAYAFTTKDAWGNEIISQYGITVNAIEGAPSVGFTNPEPLPIKTTYNLDELVGNDNLDKVVAYYYEVKEADAKKVDATFDKEKNTILANKEGELPVVLHYLSTEGVDELVSLTLTFTYVAKPAEIKDMTWVVDDKKLTAESEIVGPSVDEIKKYISGIDSEIEYTGGKVTINGEKDLEYGDEETKNSIQLSLVGLNAKGEDVQELDDKSIIKYVIRAKFDKEHVAAVPHTATVKFKNKDYTGEGVDLGNQYLYETTFTITVDQQDPDFLAHIGGSQLDDKLFVFKRADAYFEGNDATAYGKVYANGVETKTISYNLYSLYQANSILEGEELINSFVAFNEAIPEDEADEKEGKQWLESQGTSNGDISVEPSPAYGGAYMGRKITVTYAPFGNPRLNAIVDEFNLTIKSEIFEGNFEYAKKIDDKVIGTKDNPFEVDGGRSIDILESEFKKEDVYGAIYKFDDDRIVKVEVALADKNAETYLAVSDNKFTGVESEDGKKDNKVTISKNPSATGIVTPPVCKVDVKITDKWGKTKTTSIYVEVIK